MTVVRRRLLISDSIANSACMIKYTGQCIVVCDKADEPNRCRGGCV